MALSATSLTVTREPERCWRATTTRHEPTKTIRVQTVRLASRAVRECSRRSEGVGVVDLGRTTTGF